MEERITKIELDIREIQTKLVTHLDEQEELHDDMKKVLAALNKGKGALCAIILVSGMMGAAGGYLRGLLNG